MNRCETLEWIVPEASGNVHFYLAGTEVSTGSGSDWIVAVFGVR